MLRTTIDARLSFTPVHCDVVAIFSGELVSMLTFFSTNEIDFMPADLVGLFDPRKVTGVLQPDGRHPDCQPDRLLVINFARPRLPKRQLLVFQHQPPSLQAKPLEAFASQMLT